MESRIPAVNVAGILDKTIKMVIDEAPNAWRKLLLSAVAWLTSSGKTSSQAQFIKILHRDQSVVTRQINKLVADGWISKRFSDKDHRRSELFLTSKGEAILPKIKDIYRQVNLNTNRIVVNADLIKPQLFSKLRCHILGYLSDTIFSHPVNVSHVNFHCTHLG